MTVDRGTSTAIDSFNERTPPWWQRTDDEALDYHQEWLLLHDQYRNPDMCHQCEALEARDA